jgi:hypothetical protein
MRTGQSLWGNWRGGYCRGDMVSERMKFNLRYSGVHMALIGLAVMVAGLVLSRYVMWELGFMVASAGAFLLTWGIWLAFLAKFDPTGRIPIGWIWDRHSSQKYPLRSAQPVANPDAVNFCPNCGRRLDPGAVTCPQCGRRLS